MKNKFFLSAIMALGIASSVQSTYAQSSISYFYNENHYARTIASLPGNGEYVSAETITGANDDGVHISHYDATGNLINSFLLDWPNMHDQSVALIALSSQKFAVIYNLDDFNNQTVYTKIDLVDVFGNVLQDMLIKSAHPSFNSLYSLDAKWDPNFNQYILCGTAFKAHDNGPNDPKEAFVVTLDPAFNPVNMRFYNSNSGNNATDYDIANRVVLNSTGRYYVTGAENVKKPVGPGYFVMGIRNMLIDPLSLNQLWSVPLSVATDNDEISVDMAEDQNNGHFVTLVNYVQNPENWGILRIDPWSGNPIYNILETSKEFEFAHNISAGNNPNELVVTGMMHRNYTGSCGQYDQQADPFHMILDMNVFPAAGLLKSEYYTSVGNDNGALSYWTYGGFYATLGAYPLAPYMNRHMDREAPGKSYAVLAPIFAPTMNELNTKILDTDPMGNNYCKTINCTHDLDNWLPTLFPSTQLSDFDLMPGFGSIYPQTQPYHPYNKADCNSGYYRTAQQNTTETPSVADVKLYPNPVSSELKVELPAELATMRTIVTLIDMSGKVLATIFDGTGNTAISYQMPDNIANGVYFVQIASEGKITQKEKITVIR